MALTAATPKSREETAKEYNVNILKQLQAIFGHLASSKLQYYVPRGLWRHFKLQGEPVSLLKSNSTLKLNLTKLYLSSRK